MTLRGQTSIAENKMHESGVRRSSRIKEEIPITLIGSDTEGKVFLERTHTTLISLHGAGVVSQYKLSPEQEMLIRLPAIFHFPDVGGPP